MIEPTHAPSDRPGPSSGPDVLDPVESTAAQALERADFAAMNALAQDHGADPSDYPPAEPEAGRRSFAELRALLRVGSGEKGNVSSEKARGGYVVEGSPELGSARVRPSFAEALAAGISPAGLRESFADLWAIDLDVWNTLDRPPHEVAALWLRSPGRRLLQDLRTLRTMPAAPRGATDLSLERIHRAVGVDGAPPPSDRSQFASWCETRPQAWRALHLAVPGQPMLLWSSTDISNALHTLDLADEGSPASARGAALAWLLRRVQDAPQYQTMGLTRDLREELTLRLADAFTREGSTEARAPSALEEVAFAHASNIQARDREPGWVFRTWAVAHWLASCVWRSPFFGGDEPTLVARLRALAPSAVAVPRDALDPACFGASGLSVGEVAIVGGALAHPARATGVALVPPSPLVGEMRRIAERSELRPGENEAEELLTAGESNELGWSAPHVVPPLAARFWLTERQLPWLARAPKDTQAHMIELMAKHPNRFGWACFAVMEEGPELTPAAKQAASALWPTLRASADLKTYERCAFGAGILETLNDSEAEGLLDLTTAAEGTWPPFLVDILAKRAESTKRASLWAHCVDRLLDLAEDHQGSETTRLNAALFAAWRTSSKTDIASGALARLGALAGEPPFSRHSGLQRELRRRGLRPKEVVGGGR